MPVIKGEIRVKKGLEWYLHCKTATLSKNCFSIGGNMRNIYSLKSLLAGSLFAVIALGSIGSVFGQDDDEQRRSDRRSRRQQEWSDRNSRRQQAESDRSSRRQQEWSDRNSRRQQAESDRSSRHQQEWSDRNSRPQRWGGERRRSYDRNRRLGDDDNNRRRWRGRGDNDDDNDRRRRSRSNYFANDNYYRDDFTLNGGPGWKQQILRTVIGGLLGGDLVGRNDLNVLQKFQPKYNNAYSYGGYKSQPVYYNSPLYTRYNDAGFDDDNNRVGSGLGGLLNELPVAELIRQYTNGNDFISGLFGNFLTQGYDQGFLAGQSAREYGDNDGNYVDPYSYQGVYDPYSASLGQNRQLLSEGYALGYQDALNGRQDYDPASDGNTDLVSLLLNSALSRV